METPNSVRDEVYRISIGTTVPRLVRAPRNPPPDVQRETTVTIQDTRLKVLGIESLILDAERKLAETWEKQKRLREQEVEVIRWKHEVPSLKADGADATEVKGMKNRIQAVLNGVHNGLGGWQAREEELAEERRRLVEERRGLLDGLANGRI